MGSTHQLTKNSPTGFGDGGITRPVSLLRLFPSNGFGDGGVEGLFPVCYHLHELRRPTEERLSKETNKAKSYFMMISVCIP